MAEHFVHEFELQPTASQARLLRIRLELAGQFYNACLKEAQQRLRRCRIDRRWKEAGRLKRDGHGQEANALYEAVKHDVVLTERLRHQPTYSGNINTNLKYPASGIMTRLRQAHLADHLDFKSCQAMAKRAYETVERLRFQRPTRRSDGSLKFPRAHFVRYGEARAVDSHSMYWRGTALEWNSPLHKLQIPVMFDPKDPKGIQAHALAQMQNPANICDKKRVLSRTIRGQKRWFVQVTIKGQPAWKAQYVPAHGKALGIDFGPSQIGICYQVPAGTYHGAKVELAEGLRHDYAHIRRLERYLDRSRRATNPQNYHANGVPKKGLRKSDWHESTRYKAAKGHLTDLWRTYAARRKNQLGQLANELITRGTFIKIEALNYKAWQKHWGKSIGRGAPGLFVAILRRKAALVGGALLEFPTRSTKYSQLCHGCGTYQKKPLSQRVHRCACGVGPIDRDIYSAFLAVHYDHARKTLDIGAARVAFATLQCGAVDVQRKDQAASALPPVAVPFSPMAGENQSGSTAHRALFPVEALADRHTSERLANISTFQGHKTHTRRNEHASIAADSMKKDDARTLSGQKQRHNIPSQGNTGPPSMAGAERSSQKAIQLTLFTDLETLGGRKG